MKMSDDQKKLAEDNMKLVYYYLYNNNLSMDEYSDILMIELCKAAMSYDPELGLFSTFAYKCFVNRILVEFKHRNAASSRINYLPISSLDFNVLDSNNEDDEFYNMIADDSYSAFDIVSGKEFINKIYECCWDDRSRNIVDLMLLLESQSLVAKQLGCSRQNVNQTLAKIRKIYIKKYGKPEV